jgi:hypothetical protein
MAAHVKRSYPTIHPQSFRPRSFYPGHFVSWSFCPLVSLSPVILSSVNLSPDHFVPQSISFCLPVISSLGHFDPLSCWSLTHKQVFRVIVENIIIWDKVFWGRNVPIRSCFQLGSWGQMTMRQNYRDKMTKVKMSKG